MRKKITNIFATTLLASTSLLFPSLAFGATNEGKTLDTVVAEQTNNEASLVQKELLDTSSPTKFDSDDKGEVEVTDLQHATKAFAYHREDGTQIVTQSQAGEESSFTYRFPNKNLQLVDGYVVVSSYESDFPEQIIDPAWAVDQTGQSIDTEYLINGDTLTQIVHSKDAVGTVTADPYVRDAYTRGGKKMGQDLVFTRDDLATLATSGGACAIIDKIPGPYKAGCGAVSLAASDALNRNKCIALRLIGFDYGPNVPFVLYVEC